MSVFLRLCSNLLESCVVAPHGEEGELGAVIMETTANGEIRALPNKAPHVENANEK